MNILVQPSRGAISVSAAPMLSGSRGPLPGGVQGGYQEGCIYSAVVRLRMYREGLHLHVYRSNIRTLQCGVTHCTEEITEMYRLYIVY